MGFKWQIGQYLILVGVIALIVFFITDQANQPIYLIFCPGVLLIGLGGVLMWAGRGPASEARRFRLLRRARRPDKKEKKKREG